MQGMVLPLIEFACANSTVSEILVKVTSKCLKLQRMSLLFDFFLISIYAASDFFPANSEFPTCASSPSKPMQRMI